MRAMKILGLVLVLAFLPLAARAEEKKASSEVAVVKATDVKWSDAKGFPKGVMSAAVGGDPAKGAFLVLIKAPAGTTIAPHTHSADEAGTILSGSCLLGKGGKVDEKSGMELGPGAYYQIAAKAPHWFMAKTECVLARYGNGAADLSYVNPKDDPRASK